MRIRFLGIFNSFKGTERADDKTFYPLPLLCFRQTFDLMADTNRIYITIGWFCFAATWGIW